MADPEFIDFLFVSVMTLMALFLLFATMQGAYSVYGFLGPILVTVGVAVSCIVGYYFVYHESEGF